MANSEPPQKTLSQRADEAWEAYCKNTASDNTNPYDIAKRELFKSGFYAAIAMTHQDVATAGRVDEQEKKRQSQIPPG